MLFNSALFAFFFPTVVFLYFAIRPRSRWALLLAASCVFYMAAIPAYILILAFTIATDYVASLAIERSRGRRRAVWLGASIAANLGMLLFFKYYDFFVDATNPIAGLVGLPMRAPLDLILPIGLSFHTFQALSYTIEVYRGRYRAEHHLGRFALYVLFFPQLAAGPIERPLHLLPQFHDHHPFDAQKASDGLRLMAWGLFKKAVIADRLALIVDQVFAVPSAFSGPYFALGTLAFSYQIYCDFSGYTDMARGAARVMGFELVPNFDSPYASLSIPEFWRRWHISLSTWFRDYVYIPLGGSRVGTMRRDLNLVVTFLASGLWHGANWTFVAWGALHACLMVASLRTTTLRATAIRWSRLDRVPRVHRALKIALTFTLVSYAWIWFRSKTLSDAIYISTQLDSGWADGVALRQLPEVLGLGPMNMILIGSSIALLEGVQYYGRHAAVGRMLEALPVWGRWALYYAAVAGIALCGVFNGSQFIYFQF